MTCRRSIIRASSIAALILAAACGGSDAPTVPITPSPSPTPAIPSPPPPAPAPSPSPTPDASTRCDPFQDGPVARLAVAPRQQVANGLSTPIQVRARPGFDEVWCVDKDKDHRLDFNLNQRNEDGEECCWVNDPVWTVGDPALMVRDQSVRDAWGFVYRVRMDPGGRTGSIQVSARLDGNDSYPWQSGSGYDQGPITIVAMSANDIANQCLCTYLGNGIYEGARCSK